MTLLSPNISVEVYIMSTRAAKASAVTTCKYTGSYFNTVAETEFGVGLSLFLSFEAHQFPL